jgi:hypothetical protein
MQRECGPPKSVEAIVCLRGELSAETEATFITTGNKGKETIPRDSILAG